VTPAAVAVLDVYLRLLRSRTPASTRAF
jgi:hypothetical protein